MSGGKPKSHWILISFFFIWGFRNVVGKTLNHSGKEEFVTFYLQFRFKVPRCQFCKTIYLNLFAGCMPPATEQNTHTRQGKRFLSVHGLALFKGSPVCTSKYLRQHKSVLRFKFTLHFDGQGFCDSSVIELWMSYKFNENAVTKQDTFQSNDLKIAEKYWIK